MKLHRLILVCSMTLALGCGGSTRPDLVVATGSVTLNGEPIDGAIVGFQPQGIEGYARPSSATTDPQGMFIIGTFGEGDGIPLGTYRVTVKKTEIVGKLPEGYNEEEPDANAKPVKMKHIVPLIYSSPDESGLTVEVTADGLTPPTIELTGEGEVGGTGGRSNDP